MRCWFFAVVASYSIWWLFGRLLFFVGVVLVTFVFRTCCLDGPRLSSVLSLGGFCFRFVGVFFWAVSLLVRGRGLLPSDTYYERVYAIFCCHFVPQGGTRIFRALFFYSGRGIAHCHC